ncbi:MAG: DUF1365 domain-containing protein [Phenylobacterium sp.]|uniref:DUF1365 domain-containing protein n=1 Tax=Phenylobacterium sp. TaxID=1871053 RepID=UPI0027273E62|nr:DUF1365 domain-containing protein [Phenylobacterium sp.]MDO8902420.1 DUF1365 domain-containing protein [Phenylobacterium sp.]MDP2214222.1 DUF1365 domain-containing protein [Phenylobacterium sp.]
MSQPASGLYLGRVVHGRTRPRAHALSYRIFMLLVDLDEGPDLARDLRLLGFDAPGLLSFHGADHGDGSDRPLKAQVEAHLAAAGLESSGPVRLLCMPRILGAVFNPISVYFCHRGDGSLSAILYEVNNTFGDRHSYLIPAPLDAAGAMVRQATDKVFYVSPFMDMALSYAFTIRPPGAKVAVNITVSDGAGPLLSASFAGDRRPLSDQALLRAWLTHPWMTLGVMGAIHWEALKIWLKGERLRPRPQAPEHPVTVAPQAQPQGA